MSNKKIQNVFKLPSQERYGYLIRKVADFEQIFLISDEDGKFVTVGDEEIICIPVWPENEFANEFLVEDWGAYSVTSLDLSDFLDLLDSLENERYLIAGFPNTSLNAVTVSPNEIKNHLIFECNQYE